MTQELIDLADLSHCPDAAKWAAAYKQTFPDADEGLMLGWFANAMMAMHDWQAARLREQGIPDPAALVASHRQVVEALEDAAALIGAPDTFDGLLNSDTVKISPTVSIGQIKCFAAALTNARAVMGEQP